MNKTFRRKKKDLENIKNLKNEFEQNKKTHIGNIKLLEMRVELEEAAKKDFKFNKRRFDLTSDILGIEIKNLNIIYPLMEFHKSAEWQRKFQELKKFELESLNREWELFQKNSKTKLEQMKSQINIEKINEQQKRIETRNPEIIEDLKKLGVELEEKIKKQDYIG